MIIIGGILVLFIYINNKTKKRGKTMASYP